MLRILVPKRREGMHLATRGKAVCGANLVCGNQDTINDENRVWERKGVTSVIIIDFVVVNFSVMQFGVQCGALAELWTFKVQKNSCAKPDWFKARNYFSEKLYLLFGSYLNMTINFSDEDEIFTPLAKFLKAEEMDSTFKQVDIYEHHKSGVITAKTTKLPNCVFNLKKALTEIKLSDIQDIKHYINIDWTTVLDTILASSFPKVYIAVLFLKKVIHSITVQVAETDALVLYTLWYVANSGLPGREILLHDFHKSALIADVNADTLQQSFNNLEALKCIQVESDKIILTEQIVFERIYDN